jgi:SRSO17 transposase
MPWTDLLEIRPRTAAHCWKANHKTLTQEDRIRNMHRCLCTSSGEIEKCVVAACCHTLLEKGHIHTAQKRETHNQRTEAGKTVGC